jgi:hypothetical protein
MMANQANRSSAMSRIVLEVVLWIFGIRGHIPQSGGYGIRSESSLGAGGALMRVLATSIATITVLSLALWAAIWLAIKLV